MTDIAHTFRSVHRIMIQIQSRWFPLTERNSQMFTDLPDALPADFVKAMQRACFGVQDGSHITLRRMQ